MLMERMGGAISLMGERQQSQVVDQQQRKREIEMKRLKAKGSSRGRQRGLMEG